MTPQKPSTYSHWMLAEIFEQPESLRNTLGQYVRNGAFIPEATMNAKIWLSNCDSEITFAASGSSRHAALVAQSFFASAAGVLVNVDFASEYTLRGETEMKSLPLVVVSQSGQTADTLQALRRANESQWSSLAVTNVADSTMAREATVSVPLKAGIERAIPATKSFTGQLLVLQILALLAAEANGYASKSETRVALEDLSRLPEMVNDNLLVWHQDAQRIAEAYSDTNSFLFLGRGIHYPIALEGALKMKESAYIPAEGYPSGELKHGPNALVAAGTALIVLCTVDPTERTSIQRYEKTVALLQDLKEQGAALICIANKNDSVVAALADKLMLVPSVPEKQAIFAETLCLQLLSFCFAIQAGIDVDNPRNLVKSVFVE